MVKVREELRDELEALLAAGRELTPETDRYLAEQYLVRVEAAMNAPRRRPAPGRIRLRKSRRAVGGLLVAVLAVGASIAIGLQPHGGSPSAACSAFTIKQYASPQQGRLAAKGMFNLGYRVYSTRENLNHTVDVYYRSDHCS